MQPDPGLLPASSPLQMLDDYLGRHGHLSRKDVKWICGVSEQLVLRRGAPLCQAGRTGCSCGFLIDGVLQSYGVSPRGERVVLALIFPSTHVPSPVVAGLRGHSGTCVEAVTTCTLRVWPDELCRKVLDRHLGWQRLRLRVIEDTLFQVHQRHLATRMLNAKERYARMTREFPQAWQQLPQRLIASYLGITPQYLSRIKREAREAAAARDRYSQHGAT